MKTSKDPIRDYLRARRCGPHVVEGGLPYLVESWERFADEVEKGYDGSLHEWLNDADGREILDAVLDVANEDERRAWRRRVREADERVRAQLVPAGRCLWGAKVALANGWSAGKNWWYYLRPVRGSAELLEDIAHGSP